MNNQTEVTFTKILQNGKTYYMVFQVPKVIEDNVKTVSLYIAHNYEKFLVEFEARNKELKGE